MSDHWDIYFCSIEDNFASILLDMGVWNEVDKSQYSLGMGIRIPIKNPGESGTPASDEAELINELEDMLTQSLGHLAVNVGRMTTNGIREIYYYFSSPFDLDTLAREIFYKQHYYDIVVFNMEENTPWEFYFEFLYPDKYQLQHMGNRSVVDSLSESGDTLEEARRVDHWLHFNSDSQRKTFENRVRTMGFNVELDRTDDGNEYVVQIYRNDFVDLHSINEVTDLLVDLSKEFDGRYDGWETMVIK
ncbi:DUF695 domain-containing protein [Paenibacillus tarimensis]|uniref:DUF695 domain-containing protein n=1 Tax=Paenibacillus tarimensis TaxID=416012 RepID=UPI001F228CE7|nr:DUF695 domain-containing protein [Paenibacillus tarimensis]MCF2946416.1 DUF695 domain-containing protein [Paenibacillus tarimensis]